MLIPIACLIFLLPLGVAIRALLDENNAYKKEIEKIRAEGYEPRRTLFDYNWYKDGKPHEEFKRIQHRHWSKIDDILNMIMIAIAVLVIVIAWSEGLL